jgi:hypothetical protein
MTYISGRRYARLVKTDRPAGRQLARRWPISYSTDQDVRLKKHGGTRGRVQASDSTDRSIGVARTPAHELLNPCQSIERAHARTQHAATANRVYSVCRQANRAARRGEGGDSRPMIRSGKVANDDEGGGGRRRRLPK